MILSYSYRTLGRDWEPRTQTVRLDSTPCHKGGARTWFLRPAPRCGRRIAILYGSAIFACRHCHRLVYPSQREDVADRWRALYMPALVATRHNRQLGQTYQALCSAGKPAKVALTAVMRKLLILANALIRDDRKWAETAP